MNITQEGDLNPYKNSKKEISLSELNPNLGNEYEHINQEERDIELVKIYGAKVKSVVSKEVWNSYQKGNIQ